MAAASDVVLKLLPPKVSAALAAVTPLPKVRLALAIFDAIEVAAWGLVAVAFAPVISQDAICPCAAHPSASIAPISKPCRSVFIGGTVLAEATNGANSSPCRYFSRCRFAEGAGASVALRRPRLGRAMRSMVGAIGFEPTTSWSQTRRSTRISYTPLTAGMGGTGMAGVNGGFPNTRKPPRSAPGQGVRKVPARKKLRINASCLIT